MAEGEKQTEAQSEGAENSIRNKVNWVEILVVSIVIATLGWLAVTVFSMNGTLAAVEADSKNARADIARLREALPQIAQTEIHASVDLAMIASKPKKLVNGQTVATFKILDTKQSEIQTYTVNIKDIQDNEKAALLFNGAAHSIAARPVSFAKLITYSSQVGQPVTVPSNIDWANSFIISDADTLNYQAILMRNFGQPQTKKIDMKASNWLEFTVELKNNKELLKEVHREN